MNPRAAINDLLPFQGSPFSHLGTSAESHFPYDRTSCVRPNGESGIRTHAPFRTNGFQDRLVMTTSISLRMCVLSLCHLCCSPDDKSYSNKKVCYCQHIFTQFLFYFFKMRKSPFYHVFGLFLFLLNTVFSMNCVCYHVIVTNIPTICFFTTVCFSLQDTTPSPSYDFPY